MGERLAEVSTYDALRRTGLFHVREEGGRIRSLSLYLNMLPDAVRLPIVATSRQLNRLRGKELSSEREEELQLVLHAVRALVQWRWFRLVFDENGRLDRKSVRTAAPPLALGAHPGRIMLDWKALESAFDLVALATGRAAVDRTTGAVLRWVDGHDLEGHGAQLEAEPARYCRVLALDPGEQLAWMHEFAQRSKMPRLGEALSKKDALHQFRIAIREAPDRLRREWIAFRALRREAGRIAWVAASGIRPANPDPRATS